MIKETNIDQMDAKVVNPLKAAMILIPYILIGSFLSLFIAVEFKVTTVGILGFFIFFIFPMVYSKPFRNLFAKNARITFFETFLVLEFKHLRTGIKESEVKYYYQDIKSCILNSQQNKFSTIRLLFRNGKTSRITFHDENENVNSAELGYIKLLAFNKRSEHPPEIPLSPSFYASKTGTLLITLLTIGMIGIVVYQVLYSRRYLPISFFTTIAIYMQIIFSRRADKKILKKYKEK